jgi:hypothetical protein
MGTPRLLVFFLIWPMPCTDLLISIHLCSTWRGRRGPTDRCHRNNSIRSTSSRRAPRGAQLSGYHHSSFPRARAMSSGAAVGAHGS